MRLQKLRVLVLGTGLAIAAPALAFGQTAGHQSTTTAATPTAVSADSARLAAGRPRLHVHRMVTGLDHPWDIKSIGSGSYLITERDRARLSLFRNGQRRTIAFPSRKVWVSRETGLMGLAIDPQFASNRRFYSCSGWRKSGGGHDIRVIAWRLSSDSRRAQLVKTLVYGFPTSTGRHGGCRLLVVDNGALLVGTGDAAEGHNPENLRSLGGKTLRLNRFTGAPWPTNPFIHATNRHKRYVQTWGHRNIQGLTQRSDGTLWSVEHGPDRNDEVNRLQDGGDYGWNPVPRGGGAGYNENVPMTDFSLPGPQIGARWRSGFPTLATSGAAWVPGSGWGSYNGTLAIGVLKKEELLFLKFDASGRFVWGAAPARLKQYGRLRGVTRAPDGSLLVTTDNGGGHDAVLRVRP